MGKKRTKKRKPSNRSSRRPTASRRSALLPGDKRVSIEQFVAAQRDQGELDEDVATEMVWEMHPDLNRLRLSGNLPGELMDDDGNVWNPKLHVAMHSIIERQLANDDPPGIAELAIGFEREQKLDSHEIRHMLAAAVGEQLWLMRQESRLFDDEQYIQNVDVQYKRFLDAKN